MQIPPGKNIYFLSDFHLGAPNAAASLQREKLLVQFLESIRYQAAAIFLVGDMFDFWYEYRKVVPRGYTRLLGKLAEITDSGVPVHFFVGNHDMWMKTYLQEELNIPVYFEPKEFQLGGKQFYIGHGDGLGPGDQGYKALKKVFRSPVCQALFGLVPPAIGIGVADYFSKKSRAKSGGKEEAWLGEENEWLITYCKELLQQNPYDYMVFGHRHLPIDWKLGEGSRYINLGDWILYFTYAVFDGTNMQLASYTGMEHKIIRNW
ncbi:UDP-2,3-diacylglucosamine hydrolase [Cnuella takakiae]|uniref:UDP-2,3-diacylglucosamine hydrolase n=1 Tax=Cnuella takakiae TaxID=1302690 RepID=A0A1M5EUW4_9BACT|nr:UDP-2,3-diacylglucosamine diphosphatase [Cnuella takakiae]OLY91305.1 UDP-2,3-diacylglucosamine hydrolase [Cnuella takakiae]SHF82861.1 UDP-2,3-diacylglucosamine hydrolase [Cnuella takakiae]